MMQSDRMTKGLRCGARTEQDDMPKSPTTSIARYAFIAASRFALGRMRAAHAPPLLVRRMRRSHAVHACTTAVVTCAER